MAPPISHTPFPGFSQPSVALQILGVLLIGIAIAYVRRDYRDFIALGPGGTPQTWRGYVRVKILGFFALWDPYAAITLPDELLFQEGSHLELPTRKQPRPRTKGIAPHRQVDQRVERPIFEKLASAIRDMAPGKNNDLKIGTSCFEKHGTGLFSTFPANQTCRGEIVHVHPSDGSMHLTLHPSDANVVLETGWGERHPLAGVFFNRFLPRGFVMVYAPHNEDEIELVLRIVWAAC